ncbi:MAG: LLM class flavin-dependent oxidoreductase [Pseudomonadales bacterium]|nr:LLM class flavin-dependent oxidoreductase [Pseudomonadales bacterium]
MQLWMLTHSRPDHALRTAQRAEAAGWDGMLVVDSQNLAPDAYVALTLAATGTTRLGLGTGVTNSVTRHAAVTASAAMAVQQVSRGRMALGIGRGDSALAHLGRAPARFAGFARYVQTLQTYLSGGRVPFRDLPLQDELAPPVEALELADHPADSRIRWFDPALPKVPLEIAATGPQVIRLAGRVADRVMFTLGAVPDRIAWGIDEARAAARAAGRDPATLAFGAYVNLVCHPDVAVARALVRGGLTTFARFSVMHGAVAGPVDPATRDVLARLHDGYDMRAHTRADSSQAALLDDAFVDRFAIAGPPAHCLARLRELRALGLDRIVISGPTAGADPAAAREAMALLDQAVIGRV